MANIKYYVPVYGTNLRVDKFPEIAVMMPSASDVGEHLVAQKVRMSKGEKYQALQVFITEERYVTILKEIKRKIGKNMSMDTSISSMIMYQIQSFKLLLKQTLNLKKKNNGFYNPRLR